MPTPDRWSRWSVGPTWASPPSSPARAAGSWTPRTPRARPRRWSDGWSRPATGRRGWSTSRAHDPSTTCRSGTIRSGRSCSTSRPDAILVVVDAGNLARHLPLALACRDLGLPVVAGGQSHRRGRHGAAIDDRRWPAPAAGERSGSPDLRAHRRQRRRRAGRTPSVWAASGGPFAPAEPRPAPRSPPSLPVRHGAAARREGCGPCHRAALARARRPPDRLQAGVLGGVVSPRGGASIRLAEELEPIRWSIAARWTAQVERRREVREPVADRVARWATSPWPGIPAFLLVSVAMLLAVIAIGGFLASLLGRGLGGDRLAAARDRGAGDRPGPRGSRPRCCGRSTAGCWACSRWASRTS